MSTQFIADGNIGSTPEFREFANDDDEPRRLLRLNVYFDNPVPVDDGFEDRGGFWAQVELWRKEAKHWSTLLQKGMRVLVIGRTVQDRWTNSEGEPQATIKIEAHKLAVMLYRIESITASKSSAPAAKDPHANVPPTKE